MLDPIEEACWVWCGSTCSCENPAVGKEPKGGAQKRRGWRIKSNRVVFVMFYLSTQKKMRGSSVDLANMNSAAQWRRCLCSAGQRSYGSVSLLHYSKESHFCSQPIKPPSHQFLPTFRRRKGSHAYVQNVYSYKIKCEQIFPGMLFWENTFFLEVNINTAITVIKYHSSLSWTE